jgi:ATP-dependent DNA helicase DinG
MLSELFPRHAFIDLETTGLDPTRDDVIEVGALFVQAGVPVRRISQLCRAAAPLPLAIRRITGLSDADLAGAPPFSEFVPELKQALAGWTVVAHNASFEQSFLSHILVDIDADVLDSCELLHYLFPELESHSLEAVVRWAQVSDKAAHRALQDCDDTFGVLQYALRRCIEEGRGDDVTDALACLEGPERDPLVNLLRALKSHCRAAPAPLALEPTGAFLEGRPGRRRKVPAAAGGEHEPVPTSDDDLRAILGEGGALVRTVAGFQARPQQLAMALQVGRSLAEGGALGIEAGAGTGKSLAYLTPAALFAARNGWKVAVATHTKALQDQLMEKDLPKLHQATDGAFEYALIKGQNNYLCRRRALENTRADPGADRESRAARAYLRAYLRRSPEGDLDRLSYWFRDRFPAVVSLAAASRSEAATTLGDRCPHFHRCFYHSAVAQAKAADVVVINQALAAAWPPRYPAFQYAVVDEAHELEDVLTNALTVELNGTLLARLADRLSARQGRGVLSELRRRLNGAAPLMREAEQDVQRLREASLELGAAVASICRLDENGDLFEVSRGYAPEQRLTAEIRVRPEWERLERALRSVAERLGSLLTCLGIRIPREAIGLSDDPSLEKDLGGCVAALQETTSLVDGFLQGPQPDVCLAASLRPERGEWRLTSQPLEVRDAFQRAFASRTRGLVLSSATLSTAEGNPWVLERLGLEAPLYRAETPFDLARQSLVILVSDAPSPQSEDFLGWAADRIGGLAEFMGGRVLGLFASMRRLEEVGARVRARLEPRGIEVLRQSWGNGRALAARQERDSGSVLLGTKSFWQGVDIPGRAVSCVFIDKLPIEPSSRPIVAAREEKLGGGPAGFAQYRLPRALLLLRQGVGRLIRSLDDRGVVIIADPGSETYRDEVRAALAGYHVEVMPWQRARLRVHETLVSMGLQNLREPAATAVAALADS